MLLLEKYQLEGGNSSVLRIMPHHNTPWWIISPITACHSVFYSFRMCVKSKDKCISFNKNYCFVCLNQVTITPRLLLSHLSGIRHYAKDPKKVREEKEKAKRLLKPPEKKEERDSDEAEEKSTQQDKRKKSKDAKHDKKKKEFEHEEYYLKDSFEDVIQALDLFKDDPLIFEPGELCACATQ